MIHPVVLVCNRFSDGNGGTADLADHAAGLPGVLACAPTSPAELADCLHAFARHPVAAIAVDGGDGTLREVLSVLPEAFGGSCPPVALLPSGKTNLAARDVGSFGSGRAGLARLLTAARAGWQGAHWSERPALEVTWPDQPERRVRGLLFGAGAFTYATRKAGPWAHEHGFYHRSAVAVSMARVVWDVLRGKAAVADPALSVGTGPAEASACFLMMATTARRLMLGFWPFPPVSAGDALSWVTVDHPARHLAGALWRAWRGRLLPHGGAGVNGGRTPHLRVSMQGAFVVDGEIFEAGPAGIILRAGPSIRFVSG